MSKTTIDLKESFGRLAHPEELAEGQVKFRVRLIAPGQGASGYYPAEVLERDGPKVFKRGTHMHQDHQSMSEWWEQPAGSLDNLVGVIDSEPVYERAHPDGEGLYADVRVFSEYAKLYKEIAPYVGVSISTPAIGEDTIIDGMETLLVTELIESTLTTVDFVTHPGANGRIVEVLESKKDVLPPGTVLVTNAVSDSPPRKRKFKMELTEETAQALLTALQQMQAQEAARAAAEAAAEQEAEKVNVGEVISVAVAKLTESDLPKPAKMRVVERVSAAIKAGDPNVDLDRAIADEQAYTKEVLEAAAAGAQGVVIREAAARTGTPSASALAGWMGN